jgi:hypothetical protein
VYRTVVEHGPDEVVQALGVTVALADLFDLA